MSYTLTGITGVYYTSQAFGVEACTHWTLFHTVQYYYIIFLLINIIIDIIIAVCNVHGINIVRKFTLEIG